jgi:hypothetical protein
MTTPTTQTPRQPKNLGEWLLLVAIGAVAGAYLGSRGRGPVSEEDVTWQKWAGMAAEWVVTGGIAGAVVQWLNGGHASYWRAIILWAITMPVFMLFTELVRTLAAWYTGGWERNAASAGVGALVGVVLLPLVILLFAALGKIPALRSPSAVADTGPSSAKPD